MTKNKMNIWVKLILIFLGSAVIGGVIGFCGAWFFEGNTEKVTMFWGVILSGLQKIAIPAMIIITIGSILYGEWNLSQMRKIGHLVLTTEEEECDKWEYLLEKNSAWGTGVNIVSMVVATVILTSGYSLRYIANGNAFTSFILCILFLVLYGYDAFWQTRLVKETQKIFPQMQGDPTSVNFHQQWLDSCDEAEKEHIYQSAYKCYIQMGKWVQVLLLITMLGQLLFQTGILAVLVVAVIWLLMTITYLKSCVQLKKNNLQ